MVTMMMIVELMHDREVFNVRTIFNTHFLYNAIPSGSWNWLVRPPRPSSGPDSGLWAVLKIKVNRLRSDEEKSQILLWCQVQEGSRSLMVQQQQPLKNLQTKHFCHMTAAGVYILTTRDRETALGKLYSELKIFRSFYSLIHVKWKDLTLKIFINLKRF